MARQKMLRLGVFREDPDNVSEATEEEIQRLAGKLKRVPLGLAAMRIAYVTDAPGGGCMVVSGNKRLRCLKAAYGEDGEVPAEWFQDITAMSEAERHEFRLNANISDGHFNLDKLLAQYDQEELSGAGLDDLLKEVTLDKFSKRTTNGVLLDRFGVPPLSILDTRQGYWQDRKRQWLAKTGNLSLTKECVLSDSLMREIGDGSSNFDPVLAELMFKWFAPKGGKILDPFGGEQTKGVVAGELGFDYTAVEFRADQVQVNNEATKGYKSVRYYCGDSNNISTIVPGRGFDFVFTSPPYYDLEVYSKEDMSALGTYDEFMRQYENIFAQCVDMLADNRFLVVKICEIRNKKTGVFRNFVGDNIALFNRLGLQYYNEIILLNQVGTAALRVNKQMVSRKLVKTHQNILVFFKGDVRLIKKLFPIEDIADTFGNFEEGEDDAQGDA